MPNMTFNIDLEALYNERGKYTDFGYQINKETDPVSGETSYALVCGELLAVDGDEVEVDSMHFDSIHIANRTDNYCDSRAEHFRLSHSEFNIVTHGMLGELYTMSK